MIRFRRILPCGIVMLGIGFLGPSCRPWSSLRAPDLRITAAHVRDLPRVGERLVVDLLLRNAGDREASRISISIHASGHAGERIPTTKGLTLFYDGVISASHLQWTMAGTSNEWAAGDDVRELSLFGRVNYVDLATGTALEQPICLVVTPPIPSRLLDPGPLLVDCSGVPPKPLLPSQAVSSPIP